MLRRVSLLVAVVLAILAAVFVARGLIALDPRPPAPPLKFMCVACGHEFVPTEGQLQETADFEDDSEDTTDPMTEERGLTCPACYEPRAFRAYLCGNPDCQGWFVPDSSRGPVPKGYLPTCPDCGWQPTVRPAE